MKSYLLPIFAMCILVPISAFAQSGTVMGRLLDDQSEPVAFANVLLHAAEDNVLVKAHVTDEAGRFHFEGIATGNYTLHASYVGLATLVLPAFSLEEGATYNLGDQVMTTSGIVLQQAEVKADRAIVEVKPDRISFNIQGTINATGQDALALLRKAPGVQVDNNDNLSVLGRSGVMIYIDGRRLPLGGAELANYLGNLQAEQIDRIDIITNPGAKYDAQGNAGIIDIRLKKDQNTGGNGSINANYAQGRYYRSSLGGNGNYRNKIINVFGSALTFSNRGFNTIDFNSTQNQLSLDEINRMNNRMNGIDLRLGTDYFIGKNHTIGFIANQALNDGGNTVNNRVVIAPQSSPANIDSILIARTKGDIARNRFTGNLNYRYDNKKGQIFNIDADLGRFNNDYTRRQFNDYFEPNNNLPLTARETYFNTPTDIQILTFKTDYEQNILGGTMGLGAKYSQVNSDNVFHVSNVVDGNETLDPNVSNSFFYDENVWAGYATFNRKISSKWSFSAGLRMEHTNITGELVPLLPELQEPTVRQDYFSWFPSGGLTWLMNQHNTISMQYSKRINRPDYQVLNPFNNQLSELSYERGNPFLRPEIVHNAELGYTLMKMYNLKIGYSRTLNQITRLIGPDQKDPRATFISWDNLSRQSLWSANISAPVTFFSWWNAYFNFTASHIHNEADYGGDATIDLKAFNYTIYHQQTFSLPFKFKGEISGWYSGPGIWGGVFLYDPSWSLDLGIQRRFLDDRMNVRMMVTDIFYETYWSGVSRFNGLEARGQGAWDSRRFNVSVTFDLGNKQIRSRKRKTGIEEEAKRVGGE